MTADLAELAAWIKVLARPTVELTFSFNAAGPIGIITDYGLGRSSERPLTPVSA